MFNFIPLVADSDCCDDRHATEDVSVDFPKV